MLQTDVILEICEMPFAGFAVSNCVSTRRVRVRVRVRVRMHERERERERERESYSGSLTYSCEFRARTRRAGGGDARLQS